MARPQLGPAPVRPVDTARAQDLPGGLTRSVGILNAGLAARTIPCRIGGAGSSTMAGANATTTARRFFDTLIALIQAAYPSGTGSETAVAASTSATFTPSTAAGVHGFNAGEGGTTAATYLTAAERTALAGLGLRALLHMIGANDYSTGVAPATYKANVLAVLTDLKSKQTTPCVHVLIHTYQRMDVTSPAYPWAAYGQALAELAAADPDNVAFLDISDPYRLVGVPGADPLNLVDTDNVHQTDPGHALMADLIRAALGVPLVAGVNPVPAAAGGGGGGATVAADNYNRADSTTIGNTPTGNLAPVTSGTVTPAILGQQIGHTSATGIGAVLYDTGLADVTIEADLAALGTGAANQQGGLAIRGTDAGNMWWLSTRKDGSTVGFDIYKIEAGSPVRMTTTGTGTPTAGQRLRVTASGSTITAYVDGTQVAQATGATFNQTATRAGFAMGAQGLATRWDNLSIRTNA